MKILITGATSGIGKQLALDYRKEGNEVWAVGRNSDALQQLNELGIHTGQIDLTLRSEALSWFATLDSLDLAILNAGTCTYFDMPDFNSDSFNKVIKANLNSFAISIEGVLPLLLNGVRPHLVGVGSSAAYLPFPRAEAYGSSKAAVSYLMKTLSITLKRSGVCVSLVCPGFVKTPLTDMNDFPMPFRITTTEASNYIRKGISKRRKEIHFPGKFTYLLKALALLPDFLWEKIAEKMVR